MEECVKGWGFRIALLIHLCGTRRLTFGAHWKCIPGTGNVVTYIVMQRYRYNVPMIKKNLRPTIDLKGTQGGGETGLPVVCLDHTIHPSLASNSWSSGLSLLSAGITGTSYHAWLPVFLMQCKSVFNWLKIIETMELTNKSQLRSVSNPIVHSGTDHISIKKYSYTEV